MAEEEYTLNEETLAIKKAVEDGYKKGKLQQVADKLSIDLDELYEHYITEKKYPAWKLVEDLKYEDQKRKDC